MLDQRTKSKDSKWDMIPHVCRTNCEDLIKCLKDDYKIDIPEEFLDCFRKVIHFEKGIDDFLNSK